MSFQERECELAQIRNRFQKGSNMWKNKDEAAEINKTAVIKVGQQASDTHTTKMFYISQSTHVSWNMQYYMCLLGAD